MLARAREEAKERLSLELSAARARTCGWIAKGIICLVARAKAEINSDKRPIHVFTATQTDIRLQSWV